MKPGFYDIPHETYHGTEYQDYTSSSDFKRMEKSMAHYRYYKDNPPESNAVFDFGRIFHTAVLEPDKLKNQVVVWDKDKRGKAWTEFKEKHQNKVILKPDEFETIAAMSTAVQFHDIASAIISHKEAEVEKAVLWYDKDTGEKCKAKPDIRVEPEGLIADLKSVQSAEPGMFSRACANYGYMYQSAFYADGASAVSGKDHKHFLFICVEKDPPHAVMVYEADYEFIETGRIKYRELLKQLSQCKIENKWPGYPVGIKTLSLPAWATQID